MGDYRGVVGTGKRVSIQGISIHRIAGGRIVEHWGRSDILGLLQQMGAIPDVPAGVNRDR